MNKYLMMKAAVQFKGVWPDGVTFLQVDRNGGIRTYRGRALARYESEQKAYLLCDQDQFESFVESLFNGAPEGATHVDCENTKRYYRYDGRDYHLISYISPVRCANFDKLIPRPAKKVPIIGDTPEQLKEVVQPKATPYKPEKGDHCTILTDYVLCGNSPLTVKRGDIVIVKDVVDLGFGEVALITDENVVGSGTIIFSNLEKLKTELDPFIEQAIEDYAKQAVLIDVNQDLLNQIFGAMYDAGYTKGEVK